MVYSGGPLHADEQELGDQQEPIHNSSLLMYDVSWKTCRERWTIETNGERGSGKSVLAARHNDDNIMVLPRQFRWIKIFSVTGHARCFKVEPKPGWFYIFTLKMVLDTSLLNTQQYKVRIEGKGEQSRERVAPSPTFRGSSYWKRSLLVANFTFYTHTYIYAPQSP